MAHVAEALRYKTEVAGSISDLVTASFHWHNPSGLTMALGPTHPLKEMSSRNISWGGKGGWCLGLTLPPRAYCLEIWEPQLLGTIRACNRSPQGLITPCNRVILEKLIVPLIVIKFSAFYESRRSCVHNTHRLSLSLAR